MATFLFSTTISLASTTPDNQEFALALGAISLVHWTSTQSLTFIGIAATGGNIDGMVVCFSNENTSNFNLAVAHESSSESTLANRCRCATQITASATPNGALWFRYNGTTTRWHQIGKC